MPSRALRNPDGTAASRVQGDASVAARAEDCDPCCALWIEGTLCGCNADPDSGPFYALESQVVEASIAAGSACVIGKVGDTCVQFCVPGDPVPLPEGATVVDLSVWYADCQPCCDEGEQPPDPPCCEGDCTGSGGTGQQTCHNRVTVDEFENTITDVLVVWSATVVLVRRWCCPNEQATGSTLVEEQQTITLSGSTPINQVVSGACDPISGESEVFGPYTFNACPALTQAQVLLRLYFTFTTGDTENGPCRPIARVEVNAGPIGSLATVEAESCTTVSGTAGVTSVPELCVVNFGTGETVEYVLWTMGVDVSAVAQGRFNCVGAEQAAVTAHGGGIGGVLSRLGAAASAMARLLRLRKKVKERVEVKVSRRGPCGDCGRQTRG